MTLTHIYLPGEGIREDDWARQNGRKGQSERRERRKVMERVHKGASESGGIKGRRQMPRGRSERGAMMEINGEWQLRD